MEPDFKGFANKLISIAHDGGDISGGDLQDIALKYGLLEEVKMFCPCSESCVCAEVGEFPMICLRKTYQ